MTYDTIRLSNRQFAMLKRINSEKQEPRNLNQTTLRSLVLRGFVVVGYRSVHTTLKGVKALTSFTAIQIYRKISSDNLFQGFEQYAKRA